MDASIVLLVVGAERWPVRRDVGLGALDRCAALLGEGRIEVVRLALECDPPRTLHLLLGAQPIALLEEGALAEEHAPAAPEADLPGADFPDVGAYLRDP